MNGKVRCRVVAASLTLASLAGGRGFGEFIDEAEILTDEAIMRVTADPSSVVIIDVRSEAQFARQRIPGSLNMPLHTIKTRRFLAGSPILLVDEGYGSQVTLTGASHLRAAGFDEVHVLRGGLHVWQFMGGALEGDVEADVAWLPASVLPEVLMAQDWTLVFAGFEAETLRLPEQLPEIMIASDEATLLAWLASPERHQPGWHPALVVTPSGEVNNVVRTHVAASPAPIFVLEGGWRAWETGLRWAHAQEGSGAIASHKLDPDRQDSPRNARCGSCPP